MSNKIEALKELLYKMADDQLIIGHRNSEWIGLGPILEEDIAFGSIAQDKVGHAYNLYQVLEKLGEGDPDVLGFHRGEADFKSSQIVELPIGGYDFSLARHFLFDHAELIRFELLSESSFTNLADLSKKFYSEIKYHVFHANTWMRQLMTGTEESRARMQSALKEALPYMLGYFEPGKHEQILIDEGIFAGEQELKSRWIKVITDFLADLDFSLDFDGTEPVLGGRFGYHSEHLKPLLEEMTEVSATEPSAQW